MPSVELEIVLLILALYASTCMLLVYADEGVLVRVRGGLAIRIANDRIRIAGRSLLVVNPLAPMWPAFRGRWGDPAAVDAQPGLPPGIAAAIGASRALAPFAIPCAGLVVLGIPSALLGGGVAMAIPVAVAAYLVIIAMLVRLWFLRGRLALDATKFALVAFESIACPPFAAGLVRRLSMAIPLHGDLLSYAQETGTDARRLLLAALAVRAGEIASFRAEGSPGRLRLEAYQARVVAMAALGGPVSAGGSGAAGPQELP